MQRIGLFFAEKDEKRPSRPCRASGGGLAGSGKRHRNDVSQRSSPGSLRAELATGGVRAGWVGVALSRRAIAAGGRAAIAARPCPIETRLASARKGASHPPIRTGPGRAEAKDPQWWATTTGVSGVPEEHAPVRADRIDCRSRQKALGLPTFEAKARVGRSSFPCESYGIRTCAGSPLPWWQSREQGFRLGEVTRTCPRSSFCRGKVLRAWKRAILDGVASGKVLVFRGFSFGKRFGGRKEAPEVGSPFHTRSITPR